MGQLKRIVQNLFAFTTEKWGKITMISLKSIKSVKIKGNVCSKITVVLKHQLCPKVQSHLLSVKPTNNSSSQTIRLYNHMLFPSPPKGSNHDLSNKLVLRNYHCLHFCLLSKFDGFSWLSRSLCIQDFHTFKKISLPFDFFRITTLHGSTKFSFPSLWRKQCIVSIVWFRGKAYV